jgi:ribosomal protein L29
VEDDIDGAAQEQGLDQPQDGQEDAQGSQGQDGQAQGRQQVSGGGAGKAPGTADEYRKALAAKDAEIEALQARVAEAAKTSKATEELNAQIAALKRQMADERVEFALRSAGARNVKAARALLADHDGDVAALREAEPWLFLENKNGPLAGDSQANSQVHGFSTTGATGLEPAGVAGGRPGERQMRHWEEIAGLAPAKDEGKE